MRLIEESGSISAAKAHYFDKFGGSIYTSNSSKIIVLIRNQRRRSCDEQGNQSNNWLELDYGRSFAIPRADHLNCSSCGSNG